MIMNKRYQKVMGLVLCGTIGALSAADGVAGGGSAGYAGYESDEGVVDGAPAPQDEAFGALHAALEELVARESAVTCAQIVAHAAGAVARIKEAFGDAFKPQSRVTPEGEAGLHTQLSAVFEGRSGSLNVLSQIRKNEEDKKYYDIIEACYLYVATRNLADVKKFLDVLGRLDKDFLVDVLRVLEKRNLPLISHFAAVIERNLGFDHHYTYLSLGRRDPSVVDPSEYGEHSGDDESGTD